MYQDQVVYRSPLWGSSPSHLQCEQDFWKGANSSTSSSLSSSPNGFFGDATQDGPNFGSVPETMDYSEMEVLGSVILPELSDFGPEDLFPDLVEDHLVDSKEKISIEENHPKKIIIKLKKVKRPLKKSEYEITVNKSKDREESLHSSQSYSNGFNFQSIPAVNYDLVNRYELHDDFSQLIDLASEVYESRLPEPAYSPVEDVSLLDALDSDNQDTLLDEILYQSSPCAEIQPESPLLECVASPTSSVTTDDCSISVGNYSPVPSLSPNNTDYFAEIPSPQSCLSELSTIEHHTWDPVDNVEFVDIQNSVEYNVVEPKSKRGSKLSKEMKYLRKKQQNKEAAIRYRQKKKEEEEEFYHTLGLEEKENKQLRKDYKGLKRELAFMKNLMRETFAEQLS